MSNFLQNHRYTVIALGVLLVIFMMSAYIVPEEEQAVIIRTGEPVGTVNTPNGTTNAGIYFRVPFIDSVRRVEKRLLSFTITFLLPRPETLISLASGEERDDDFASGAQEADVEDDDDDPPTEDDAD